MFIKIPVADRELLKDYAQRFVEHKKDSKVKQESKHKTPLELNLKGFTAEYIFKKYMGVPFSWDFNPNYEVEDICLQYKDVNYVCDVKSSIYRVNGRLVLGVVDRVLEKHIKEKNVQAFIAVRVAQDCTGGEVLGIVTLKKFCRHKFMHTFDTPVPCMDLKYLTPITEDFKVALCG